MANKTALYRFYCIENTLLYIGVSATPFVRLKAHRSDKKDWACDVSVVKIEYYQSRTEALNAEAKAIQCESPKHNVFYNVSRNIPKRTPGKKTVSRQCFGTEKAEKFFVKNPHAKAKELAKKFGVAPSTIYRAPWFKKPEAVPV